jgi:hypothetical protein
VPVRSPEPSRPADGRQSCLPRPRRIVEWLAKRAEADDAGFRVIGFRGHRTEGAVVAGEERGAARMRPA